MNMDKKRSELADASHKFNEAKNPWFQQQLLQQKATAERQKATAERMKEELKQKQKAWKARQKELEAKEKARTW